MNISKKSFISFALLSIFFLISQYVFAHFGTKGPFGGSVSCTFVFDSTLYIGTANGGVFESTNSTLGTWRARPVGLKSGKITALTHSGNYLFAGTADSGIFIFNGYVGADRYWNKITNGLGNLSIRSLLAIDSITVLAGTNGGGLYKTMNKGATWTLVSHTSLNNTVISGMVKAGSRIILLTEAGGVFTSDDNGDNWSDFNDINTLGIAGTTAISYNATSDEIMVLNNDGLFISPSASTASTATFTSAPILLTSGTVIRGISNNGSNWYLATSGGVYTSTTGIVNWNQANTGLSFVDVTAITAFKSQLVVGISKEGVFKTAATTINWTASNNGFSNPVTFSMAAAGDSLVIAATEKGIFISKNLATSYVSGNNGLTDSLNITDVIIAKSYLLVSSKNAGVFSSADTGKTWTAANTGLSDMHITKLFYANNWKYAIDAGGNIFVSDLDVTNWTSIQNGLPNGVVPSSMAFYSDKILLGTLGNGLYIRNVSSGNWNIANNGLNNVFVTSVTAQGPKIYAGTDDAGVFVSDSGTISWISTANTSISHTNLMGLNGNSIQAMASFQGYVYASYKGGLLASSDNGVTWIAGGNQFNLPSFTDVNKICFVTSRVFVPTENNALYSNSLSELPPISTSVKNMEQLNGALRISPNPGYGRFRVEIMQPGTTVSHAQVYDITGKFLQNVAFDNADEYFSLSYPAGIYFILFETTQGSFTQKIVIR